MNNFYRLPLLVLLLFVPFYSLAQNNNLENRNQTVRLIIEKTNVQNILAQRIASLEAQLQSNPFGLPANKNERMLVLFRKSFDSDSLIQKVNQTFIDEYNADRAQSVKEWLSTDGGGEIVTDESEFYTTQGARKQIIARYELDKNAPSKNFVATIDSLIKSTSAIESTVDTYATIFRSALSALNVLSNQQTITEQRKDAIISNYRSQIQPQISQVVTRQFQVMFFKTDETTLAKYLAFNKSDAGKWLNQSTTAGIKSALDIAADNFVSAVESEN